jgi:hypothetical protein
MPSKDEFDQVMQCVKSSIIGRDRKERYHTFQCTPLEQYMTKMEMELLLLSLFPAGKIAAKSSPPKEKHAMRTIDFIFSGEEIIFNATFMYKGEFLQIPLIKKVQDSWEIYHTNHHFCEQDFEIVASTLGKHRIKKVYTILLNPNYIRQSNLDLESLFFFKDESTPLSDSETNTKRVQKKWELYLNKAIALDINTFATRIPLYDSSRPYQMIPFQFTAVISTDNNCEPKAFSYIGDGTNDPREALIQKLIQVCEEKLPIIVFSLDIEIKIIEELARDFPKYVTELLDIKNRMIAIEEIIKTHIMNATVANTAFNGNIPKYIPESTFEEMPENNNLSIQDTYKLLKYTQATAKRDALIAKIQDYCSHNTLGLFQIYNFAIQNKKLFAI